MLRRRGQPIVSAIPMWGSRNSSRAIVYVDGFNLYHGMKDAFSHRYLWLDLHALGTSMMLEGQQLQVVRYFTAPSRNDPAGGARQADYLEALSSCHGIEIHLGRSRRSACAAALVARLGSATRRTKPASPSRPTSCATPLAGPWTRRSWCQAIATCCRHCAPLKDMQPTMAVVAPFRRGGPVQSSSASLRPASRSAAPSCGTLSFPRLSRVRSARCNAPAHWR